MTLLDSIRNVIYIKVKINYNYEHLFLYTQVNIHELETKMSDTKPCCDFY